MLLRIKHGKGTAKSPLVNNQASKNLDFTVRIYVFFMNADV